MDAEVQARKKYYHIEDDPLRRETTSLPGNPVMPAHTAEVLRQVEASGVIPGGWVGGDAWFGSVATSVEVFKRFSVHSTFIVKNNQDFFPMKALRAVLDARHGDRPAGHWVTMTTTISGVPLIDVDVDASQGFVAGMEEQPSHLLNSRSSREGQLAIRMCGIVSFAEDTSRKRGCKSTIRRPSGVANATCPCAERIDAITKNFVPREVEHFLASTHTIMPTTIVPFAVEKCMVRRRSSQGRSGYRCIQDAAAENSCLK
ncbi:hypothetical protein IV203_022013 [Nitzschia inconspicua]|uniref:Uncharacterized protein n=1 Tax=Nitzschia inconspicua TaxID=303405 RepID=A0A9K3PED0_9STRA|nr:hypothetical protein IV203_022013 [Nitzschia inconspicua]